MIMHHFSPIEMRLQNLKRRPKEIQIYYVLKVRGGFLWQNTEIEERLLF